MTKLEARNPELETAPPAASAPVRDFKDLEVWKLPRNLWISVYVLLKKLPAAERFALNRQLRRAVQSIGANIAEGFGGYSYQEIFSFVDRRAVRL